MDMDVKDAHKLTILDSLKLKPKAYGLLKVDGIPKSIPAGIVFAVRRHKTAPIGLQIYPGFFTNNYTSNTIKVRNMTNHDLDIKRDSVLVEGVVMPLMLQS